MQKKMLKGSDFLEKSLDLVSLENNKRRDEDAEEMELLVEVHLLAGVCRSFHLGYTDTHVIRLNTNLIEITSRKPSTS